jgi:hypothetical protein
VKDEGEPKTDSRPSGGFSSKSPINTPEKNRENLQFILYDTRTNCCQQIGCQFFFDLSFSNFRTTPLEFMRDDLL